MSRWAVSRRRRPDPRDVYLRAEIGGVIAGDEGFFNRHPERRYHVRQAVPRRSAAGQGARRPHARTMRRLHCGGADPSQR